MPFCRAPTAVQQIDVPTNATETWTPFFSVQERHSEVEQGVHSSPRFLFYFLFLFCRPQPPLVTLQSAAAHRRWLPPECD